MALLSSRCLRARKVDTAPSAMKTRRNLSLLAVQHSENYLGDFTCRMMFYLKSLLVAFCLCTLTHKCAGTFCCVSCIINNCSGTALTYRAVRYHYIFKMLYAHEVSAVTLQCAIPTTAAYDDSVRARCNALAACSRFMSAHAHGMSFLSRSTKHHG